MWALRAVWRSSAGAERPSEEAAAADAAAATAEADVAAMSAEAACTLTSCCSWPICRTLSIEE